MLALSDGVLSSRGPAQGVAMACPRLARLSLTEFRNYRCLTLPLPDDAGIVVLTGENGAGKTNLMEAISLLSPGRGLRGARLAELTRTAGEGPWRVAAKLATDAGERDLGTGLQAETGGPDRRLVRIDRRNAQPAELAGVLAVLWLTPQMDRLFLEGAGGRRRFLDRLAFLLDPEHAKRVAGYERVLRERARLLANGDGRLVNPAWLAALETQAAELGVAIAAGRLTAVEQLNNQLASAVEPDFPTPQLTVEGAVEAWLMAMPALSAEARFAEALRASRARDAAAGSTSAGPHRSDLLVSDRRRDMPAARCSTGEQKALLLAIVLAEANLVASLRGLPPILLLDEVTAHLDEGRRRALCERLPDCGAQVWLTGTEPALFHPLQGRARALHVADGQAWLEE